MASKRIQAYNGAHMVTNTPQSTSRVILRYVPGIVLCIAVSIVALLVQHIEMIIIGHTLIESLVIAIVIGILCSTFITLPKSLSYGISFSTKQVLELAIVLLGASINISALLAAGPVMLVSIAGVVIVGIFISTRISQVFGLNSKLAILIACGNSICGNSAIAAIAPVIGADKKDVASSITFTAVLGVVVVLTLPLLIAIVNLSLYQYGVLAGMTVYAVPQVIAATFPVSQISGEVGTLVKLVRVLMLGPVVLFFALRFRDVRTSPATPALQLNRYLPWFIIGFVGFAVLRSVGLVPSAAIDPLREVSRFLTIIAMAALGLGVDIRSLRSVSKPVIMAVIGSLLALITLSLILIKIFGIAGV